MHCFGPFKSSFYITETKFFLLPQPSLHCEHCTHSSGCVVPPPHLRSCPDYELSLLLPSFPHLQGQLGKSYATAQKKGKEEEKSPEMSCLTQGSSWQHPRQSSSQMPLSGASVTSRLLASQPRAARVFHNSAGAFTVKG